MINSYICKSLDAGKDGILHVGEFMVAFEGGGNEFLFSYRQIKKIEKFDQKFLVFNVHGVKITFESESDSGQMEEKEAWFTLFKRDTIYEEMLRKWDKAKSLSVEEIETGLKKEIEELRKL